MCLTAHIQAKVHARGLRLSGVFFIRREIVACINQKNKNIAYFFVWLQKMELKPMRIDLIVKI